MSNGVCLNKINLGREPEPEILPQAAPTLFPTANTALKLINPKYSLVTGCTFATNGPNANNDITNNQKESHIKDAPALPHIHPGLLNMEKANMIHYVPTWPDPEPPSDVIGFINIRDTNKPLQAHLMRSELFEVSQAIRFKDSISEPKEPVMAHPVSKPICDSEDSAQTQTCTGARSRSGETERNAEDFDQNQQQESSQSEDLISPLQSPQPETVHVLTGNREDKEAPDVMIIENENTDSIPFDASSDIASSDIKQTLDTPQALQCPAQTPNNPDVKSPSFDILNDKVIIDVDTKPVDETQQNGYDTHTSNTDSNFSSSSDYFDCFSPLTDLRCESEVLLLETPSDTQSHNQKNIQQEREFPCLNSFTAQDTTDDKQTKLLKTSCSIIFSFPSSNSISPAPFKTTPVREGLHDEGAVTNERVSNNGFNFSSTSDEYFECSDTVEFDGNVMEASAQLNVNDYRSELRDKDSIPAVTLQIQKLTEMTMQEDDEHCDLESRSQNVTESGSEKQSVMEMTVNGHLEANNPEVVSRIQADEYIYIHQTREPEDTQPEELRSEKSPLIDFQPEVNLDLMCEGKRDEKTEKQIMLDLQPDLNLDLMCERQSVQTTEKTVEQQIQPEELRSEKSPLIDLQPEVKVQLMFKGESVKNAEKQLQLDLQPKVTLDFIREGRFVHTVENTEKLLTQDLQPEVNLDLICDALSVKTSEKSSDLQRQSEVNAHLMCEEEFVQTAEKTEKPPIVDSHSKMKNLIRVNGCKSQSATESFTFSVIQDKAVVIPEKTTLTKSIDLHNNEKQQNLLADQDLDSKYQENLKSAEHVNELKPKDVELIQTGLKENPEELSTIENHLNLPEDFETVELLILEDSDLQEIKGKGKNRSDPKKSKTALSAEAKPHNIKPAGLKTVNVRKPTESKIELYSKHGKQTCPMAAPVKRKERERVSAIQAKKNQPKLDCQVKKVRFLIEDNNTRF